MNEIQRSKERLGIMKQRVIELEAIRGTCGTIELHDESFAVPEVRGTGMSKLAFVFGLMATATCGWGVIIGLVVVKYMR